MLPKQSASATEVPEPVDGDLRDGRLDFHYMKNAKGKTNMEKKFNAKIVFPPPIAGGTPYPLPTAEDIQAGIAAFLAVTYAGSNATVTVD